MAEPSIANGNLAVNSLTASVLRHTRSGAFAYAGDLALSDRAEYDIHVRIANDELLDIANVMYGSAKTISYRAGLRQGGVDFLPTGDLYKMQTKPRPDSWVDGFLRLDDASKKERFVRFCTERNLSNFGISLIDEMVHRAYHNARILPVLVSGLTTCMAKYEHEMAREFPIDGRQAVFRPGHPVNLTVDTHADLLTKWPRSNTSRDFYVDGTQFNYREMRTIMLMLGGVAALPEGIVPAAAEPSVECGPAFPGEPGASEGWYDPDDTDANRVSGGGLRNSPPPENPDGSSLFPMKRSRALTDQQIDDARTFGNGCINASRRGRDPSSVPDRLPPVPDDVFATRWGKCSVAAVFGTMRVYYPTLGGGYGVSPYSPAGAQEQLAHMQAILGAMPLTDPEDICMLLTKLADFLSCSDQMIIALEVIARGSWGHGAGAHNHAHRHFYRDVAMGNGDCTIGLFAHDFMDERTVDVGMSVTDLYNRSSFGTLYKEVGIVAACQGGAITCAVLPSLSLARPGPANSYTSTLGNSRVPQALRRGIVEASRGAIDAPWFTRTVASNKTYFQMAAERPILRAGPLPGYQRPEVLDVILPAPAELGSPSDLSPSARYGGSVDLGKAPAFNGVFQAWRAQLPEGARRQLHITPIFAGGDSHHSDVAARLFSSDRRRLSNARQLNDATARYTVIWHARQEGGMPSPHAQPHCSPTSAPVHYFLRAKRFGPSSDAQIWLSKLMDLIRGRSNMARYYGKSFSFDQVADPDADDFVGFDLGDIVEQPEVRPLPNYLPAPVPGLGSVPNFGEERHGLQPQGAAAGAHGPGGAAPPHGGAPPHVIEAPPPPPPPPDAPAGPSQSITGAINNAMGSAATHTIDVAPMVAAAQAQPGLAEPGGG